MEIFYYMTIMVYLASSIDRGHVNRDHVLRKEHTITSY